MQVNVWKWADRGNSIEVQIASAHDITDLTGGRNRWVRVYLHKRGEITKQRRVAHSGAAETFAATQYVAELERAIQESS
jgi:hypothetical protein